MIITCYQCTADMREIKQDLYRCPKCGFEAEQISFQQRREYKRSGWSEMKEIAAANNVSYSTYMRRINSGQSPEEAASVCPLSFSDNIRRQVAEGKIKYAVPKSRNEVLGQIDRLEIKHCEECEVYQDLTRRYGHRSGKVQRACLVECPIGKEIQALGAQLTVKPRKSVSPAWNK